MEPWEGGEGTLGGIMRLLLALGIVTCCGEADGLIDRVARRGK
jgi:hypothetical protein